MVVINSKLNPKFKLWHQLLESKGIRREGQFLLSGKKLVDELLKHNSHLVTDVLLSENHEMEASHQLRMRTHRLSKELFGELDMLGTHSPLLVGKTPQIKPWTAATEIEGTEVVLALGDPSNLGAALRSCLAFNVSKVILCQECAHPFLPKALKAAAGATFHLEMVCGPSLRELPVVSGSLALDGQGQPINDLDLHKNQRWILGEEGLGLPEELHDLPRVKIPVNANLESLNAAVALGIALFRQNSLH